MGKRDKVSRNNDNRKHSLAENGSKASGNRTGKKGRNRNPVDKKRLDQMRAVNSRIDRKPAGSRIKDAMLPAERIPEDRFRAQFGREHHFVMHRPEVVEGRPRFQYGGYAFVLVDRWPPEWAYSDDCYIDDIDGEYFLFNSRHPEERLTLELAM